MSFFKRQSPARIIAFCFLAAILVGSLLLILPFSVKKGIELSYVDALYTSTSAVCVTGLIVADAGDTFTTVGQIILALLIQIGGLGVTTISTGIMLAIGKKIDLKSRTVFKEAVNFSSGKGVLKFVRDIFTITVFFELIGAILSFIVFSKDFETPKAIWVSIFHSIAAFNNSGFDILGGGTSLIPYQNNVLLNLTTSFLIIFGGIGFLVIRDMLNKKFNYKKLSMHSKAVILVSAVLILLGTLLLKLTENMSWLGAFFNSVTARTAGFATYPLGKFGFAGLLVMILLMFVGASPGSTGGGIKTTTLFVLLHGVKSSATNTAPKAFHYAIPKDSFKKAAVITFLAASLILLSTYLILVFDKVDFSDALFEMTSAFATVGLSTGITASLGTAGKIVSIFMMYVGRLGPMTVATLWHFSRVDDNKYPEGNISVG